MTHNFVYLHHYQLVLPSHGSAGIFIMRSRVFKCSLDHAKSHFYRPANAVSGKIGRVASEEVTLQLQKSSVYNHVYLLFSI